MIVYGTGTKSKSTVSCVEFIVVFVSVFVSVLVSLLMVIHYFYLVSYYWDSPQLSIHWEPALTIRKPELHCLQFEPLH